jgi:hypothetical protein
MVSERDRERRVRIQGGSTDHVPAPRHLPAFPSAQRVRAKTPRPGSGLRVVTHWEIAAFLTGHVLSAGGSVRWLLGQQIFASWKGTTVKSK